MISLDNIPSPENSLLRNSFKIPVMKLSSVLKTASLFFLYNFFDKALSGKLKFQSVIVEKAFLQALLNREAFLYLFFSSVYDNRVLAKDRIALVAHISDKEVKGQMVKHSLDVTDEETVLQNERNYSSYEIKKEEIRELLQSQGDEVYYFIFKPIPYPLDKDYVSYQVIPADSNKLPFLERKRDYYYAAMLNPSPPANTSFEMMLLS
jgi:hypothetical protein